MIQLRRLTGSHPRGRRSRRAGTPPEPTSTTGSISPLSTGDYAGEVGAGNRDRGLGTEAARLILAHAFETVGLHRVELEVYVFNPRARRVYDKVGFVYEGTKREALLWDGEWVDADTMSILDGEWAVHHGYPQPG